MTVDSVDYSPSTPIEEKTIVVSEDEYSKFLQYQASFQAHLPVAYLAQKGIPAACFFVFFYFSTMGY